MTTWSGRLTTVCLVGALSAGVAGAAAAHDDVVGGVDDVTAVDQGQPSPEVPVDPTASATPSDDASPQPDADTEPSAAPEPGALGEAISAVAQEPASAVVVTPFAMAAAVAPAAPVILAPADGATLNTTVPTVSGSAEAGSRIDVWIDGELDGTTTADDTGAWSYVPEAPLFNGVRVVEVAATNADGEQGPRAGVSFTVDSVAPARPVISTPTAGATLHDRMPVFTGTAEAGATIVVSIDGVEAGTTIVEPDGTWSFTTPSRLSAGSHTTSVRARDAAGNVSLARNVTYSVVASPAVSSISVQVTGSGAALLPSDLTYDLRYDYVDTDTGQAYTGALTLTPGQPVGLDGIDGATIAFTPLTPASVEGITWDAPQMTIDGIATNQAIFSAGQPLDIVLAHTATQVSADPTEPAAPTQPADPATPPLAPATPAGPVSPQQSPGIAGATVEHDSKPAVRTPSTPHTTTGGALARTGASIGSALISALAAVALGAGLLASRRRALARTR